MILRLQTRTISKAKATMMIETTVEVRVLVRVYGLTSDFTCGIGEGEDDVARVSG